MRHLNLWSSPANRFDLFREFNDLVSGIEKENAWPRWSADKVDFFTPQLDIEETETSYTFHVDIPGMKKEEIKIEVKDHELVISGERRREKKTDANGGSQYERSFGRFYRSFSLPANVEADSVEAKYDNGVLTLEVPKSKKSLPKTISVK